MQQWRQWRLLLWAGGREPAGAVHDEGEHSGPEEEAVPVGGQRRGLWEGLGLRLALQSDERSLAATPVAATRLLARAVPRLLRKKVTYKDGPRRPVGHWLRGT